VGPNDSLSKDGCISCHLAIRLPSSEIKCLQKSDNCPVGFFSKIVEKPTTDLLKPLVDRKICLPCHTGCLECTGPGLHRDECQKCANFKSNDICVTSCANDQYVDTENECQPCSPECRACYDVGAHHCLECVEFKVIADNEATFNCTLECPSEFPYVVDRVCAVRPQYIEIIIVAIIVFCAMLILILICCCKAQKARNEKVQMSLLAGFEDTVPLCQTGTSPNLRKIRIIKEAEIRKGSVLGTGEFGQVLKGLWVPENENLKIPIAIKSFRNMNDPKSSAEFMAEAQIMASLDHPNILKLMAVCLTDEMMMITQLMPLGNLLDYVRKHRDKIDSKTMLNWAVQIAQGMAYLEERRLVHRDLAARNVLVQAPTSVRIADFGMTKLMKHDTLTYESPGGKAAVKWLAPECIDHKTFTSKSDVWAFGVTIWEVLTYGAIPYTETKSHDVPKLVAAGEKLPQPDICSLELYALLLLCWNLKPELRPTFSDLKKYLTEMASDPGCYLVIVGDKLMRLPELTKEDEISFYTELANLDSSDAHVKPNPPVDADNYLLPNPPCNLPDGPGYLKMEADRLSETPTILIAEPEATDDDRYINMGAASEPNQGLDSLGRHYMNLIRNQGNFDGSRNSYVSDISIDPEEYLEPGLTS
jgi:epidermal growth factor receptor